MYSHFIHSFIYVFTFPTRAFRAYLTGPLWGETLWPVVSRTDRPTIRELLSWKFNIVSVSVCQYSCNWSGCNAIIWYLPVLHDHVWGQRTKSELIVTEFLLGHSELRHWFCKNIQWRLSFIFAIGNISWIWNDRTPGLLHSENGTYLFINQSKSR